MTISTSPSRPASGRCPPRWACRASCATRRAPGSWPPTSTCVPTRRSSRGQTSTTLHALRIEMQAASLRPRVLRRGHAGRGPHAHRHRHRAAGPPRPPARRRRRGDDHPGLAERERAEACRPRRARRWGSTSIPAKPTWSACAAASAHSGAGSQAARSAAPWESRSHRSGSVSRPRRGTTSGRRALLGRRSHVGCWSAQLTGWPAPAGLPLGGPAAVRGVALGRAVRDAGRAEVVRALPAEARPRAGLRLASVAEELAVDAPSVAAPVAAALAVRRPGLVVAETAADLPLAAARLAGLALVAAPERLAAGLALPVAAAARSSAALSASASWARTSSAMMRECLDTRLGAVALLLRIGQLILSLA